MRVQGRASPEDSVYLWTGSEPERPTENPPNLPLRESDYRRSCSTPSLSTNRLTGWPAVCPSPLPVENPLAGDDSRARTGVTAQRPHRFDPDQPGDSRAPACSVPRGTAVCETDRRPSTTTRPKTRERRKPQRTRNGNTDRGGTARPAETAIDAPPAGQDSRPSSRLRDGAQACSRNTHSAARSRHTTRTCRGRSARMKSPTSPELSPPPRRRPPTTRHNLAPLTPATKGRHRP